MRVILSRSIFANDFRVVLLRYWKKKIITAILHKIDISPDKMTFNINVKNYYAEICFVNFYCGIL